MVFSSAVLEMEGDMEMENQSEDLAQYFSPKFQDSAWKISPGEFQGQHHIFKVVGLASLHQAPVWPEPRRGAVP